MLLSEWGNSRSSSRRYLRVAGFWPGPSDARVSGRAILIGWKVNHCSEHGNSVGSSWDEDPSRSDVHEAQPWHVIGSPQTLFVKPDSPKGKEKEKEKEKETV